MSAASKISWTDSSFNPWIGCTKISPGCAHCYAAEQDKLRKWTPEGWGGPRKRSKTWGDPVKWERDWAVFQQVNMRDGTQHRGDMKSIAALELNTGDIVACGPVRRRVFCASLADWLDDAVPIEWLADLLQLIHETPHLDWLLLTKRPENWRPRVDAAYHWIGERHAELLQREPHRVTEPAIGVMAMLSNWLGGHETPANVWLGTTVENQEYAARRIPQLLAIPAAVRFLSVEPMLGPADVMKVLVNHKLAFFEQNHRGGLLASAMSATIDSMPWIDWVICGGESGPQRRAFEIEWAQSLADQCTAAGVAFFMKQDGHLRSGEQGRIPAALWGRKEFPAVEGRAA